LYRIFKLEYFSVKTASNSNDVLELERHVNSGIKYWEEITPAQRLANESRGEEHEGEEDKLYDIYSDIDADHGHENKISKAIIK
jgi:hypothetical protein